MKLNRIKLQDDTHEFDAYYLPKAKAYVVVNPQDDPDRGMLCWTDLSEENIADSWGDPKEFRELIRPLKSYFLFDEDSHEIGVEVDTDDLDLATQASIDSRFRLSKMSLAEVIEEINTKLEADFKAGSAHTRLSDVIRMLYKYSTSTYFREPYRYFREPYREPHRIEIARYHTLNVKRKKYNQRGNHYGQFTYVSIEMPKYWGDVDIYLHTIDDIIQLQKNREDAQRLAAFNEEESEKQEIRDFLTKYDVDFGDLERITKLMNIRGYTLRDEYRA